MKIILKPYDESWPGNFRAERNRLMQVIDQPGLQIEHIGSTAVPGLAAKPVIDILIGIHDFKESDSLIPLISSLGYDYISEYEAEFPDRRFFLKDENGIRTHHIHLVQTGSVFWKRHLGFRDHLRQNLDDRIAYESLKYQLARREWQHRNKYAEAKSDFIRKIETKILSDE